MTNPIGIWIDHRKAVITELAPDGARITVVESQVEKHPERGGDSPLKGRYEAQQVPADDRRQRTLTGALNRYYDAVLAVLPHQEGLFLFGPGEAKGELHRRLDRNRPKAGVLAEETADKMSDKQIIASVREHFATGDSGARQS